MYGLRVRGIPYWKNKSLCLDCNMPILLEMYCGSMVLGCSIFKIVLILSGYY